jgi:hypothetical protein
MPDPIRDALRAAALAARVEAVWQRDLLSVAEAERIGPTTLSVLAHTAAETALRAIAEEAGK